MSEDRGKRRRCSWAVTDDPLLVHYHDTEWGQPVRDEHGLFEALCLETLQAGLSWRTVLKKREAYRSVFDHFNPEKLAQLTQQDIDKHLQNRYLIRHPLKMKALKMNAHVFLTLQETHGSFLNYLRPFVSKPKTATDGQNETFESTALAKDLKKRGMTFVGPTALYAFMQATGFVSAHEDRCWLAAKIGGRHLP